MFRWTLTNLSDLSQEVLDRDPIGWEECSYTFRRDKEYHGFIQDFSVKVKFHCDGGGKAFIDNVYNTEDVDGRIEVLVEYKCDPLGSEYDVLYTGIINLASYTTDGEYTECNMERGGFATKLKSRDEIKVDLESLRSIGDVQIDAAGTNTLEMEAQEIYLRDESDFTGTYTQAIDKPTANSLVFRGFVMPTMSTISSELNAYTGLSEYEDLALNGPGETDTFMPPIFEAIDPNVAWPATLDYDFSFDGTFQDRVDGLSLSRLNTAHAFTLRYGATFASANTVSLYSSGGYSTSLATYTEDFASAASGSITLNYGDKVWLCWFESTTITVGPFSGNQQLTYDYNQFNFKLDIYSLFPDTLCKSVLIHEAFGQVVDSIVDEDDSFHSEFYGRIGASKRTYDDNGCGAFLAITNGKNIRAFPEEKIYCSLKELFDAADCQHNIGLGIETDPNDATRDVARVEPKSYFYNSGTLILSLPNVQVVQTKNDNSRYINDVKIGYQRWETEYAGGLDEPNGKHEYSTLIASIKTAYSKLCKYIASGYAIEFTRRKNYERFPTEDFRYDNENFFIAVNQGTAPYSGEPDQLTHPEKRADAFDSATGTISDIDKFYNLRLTPKRMLLSHMKTIVAGIQIIQGFVNFIRGDGNTNVGSNMTNTTCPDSYSGQGLSEDESLEYNDSNVNEITPLYGTETYSFEYPLSYSQFNTIRANPYGYISFTDRDGVEKRGFIQSLEFPMEKSALAKFELIKLPA